MDQFVDHFKNLISNDNVDNGPDTTYSMECVFEELDVNPFNLWYGVNPFNLWHGINPFNLWYGVNSFNLWHGVNPFNLWKIQQIHTLH